MEFLNGQESRIGGPSKIIPPKIRNSAKLESSIVSSPGHPKTEQWTHLNTYCYVAQAPWLSTTVSHFRWRRSPSILRFNPANSEPWRRRDSNSSSGRNHNHPFLRFRMPSTTLTDIAFDIRKFDCASQSMRRMTAMEIIRAVSWLFFFISIAVAISPWFHYQALLLFYECRFILHYSLEL